MATNKEIYDFAVKWLEKYKDPTTPAYEFDDAVFGYECVSLGFTIDDDSLNDAFDNSNAFENYNNITDVKQLADDIFSHWRYVTHFTSAAPNDETYCPWFIALLEKLKELSSQEQTETKCEIIVFPKLVELEKDIEKLHTELSMLLFERDELKYVECKNIEMHYMLSLGAIEYKAYEMQCAMLRLKRKIELIQAKKNRQEKVSIKVIESILDEEFEEYQEKLNEEIDKMNDALKRNKDKFLSEDECKEIKTLYRTIVKALHPDINLDISKSQAELFNNAVEAYKNGDITTLRIIKEMVAKPVLHKVNENELAVLKKEKERLLKIMEDIKNQITDIKNSYPYNLKTLIFDEEKIAEKKTEFEETITQFKDMIEIYENRIKEMLG